MSHEIDWLGVFRGPDSGARRAAWKCTRDNSRVLTEREWLQMWDDIRDAGYTRAA